MTLQLKELTKQFYNEAKKEELLAVNAVTLDCQPGEIFGLLGPNGAGKTTTLRMIATILRPTSGTATVCGFDISKEAKEVRRSLGYLSAETGLYERLTPREILFYFGRLSHYPETQLKDRVQSVIDLLDMSEFADTRCEKLSTGTRQKVSVARSIVHDPPVMIFDEPTSGLDVLTIRAMQQFIIKCKEQGKCILMSTHIMSEAEKLCDRIGIIHRGRLLAIGTLEQLRIETAQHYLEDIFISIVREKVGEVL
jgi:sodium transport system ATP-binding protein